VSATATLPTGEKLTKAEWEARIKMESVGRAYMVHKETGTIYPGAYLPGAGYVFVRPYGTIMIPSDKICNGGLEFEVVIPPRMHNEPVPEEVHNAIMRCLPEGVEPKPFTE